MAGEVVVAFTIEAEPGGSPYGRVSRAGLQTSELGHPLMEGCVLSVFADMRFEAPPGDEPVEVRYPFRFAPSANPDAGGEPGD